MARQCMRRAGYSVLLLAVLSLLPSCFRAEISESKSGRDTGGMDASLIESAALPRERQEYIWVIEHAAFELEKKFGKAFAKALRERDGEALRGFCRPGFEARLPVPAESPKSHDLGYLRQVSVKAAETSPADAAQFSDYLKSQLESFARIDKISGRVLDLHADDRNPESGRWSLTWYLNAVGKDASGAPVEFTSEHRVRCSFTSDVEIEAGQILDQWTVKYGKHRHCTCPLFEEVTSVAGLDRMDIQDNWKLPPEKVRQYYTQMAVEDYDRDGFLDLAVASANGRWQLLRSINGKGFRDVTATVELPPSAESYPASHGLEDEIYLAAWIDVNNDDYPDLLLGDRLFRNRDGRRFEDMTIESGLAFNYNPRGAVVADYDCDGHLDLYVLYQNSREADRPKATTWVGDNESGAENHLWRNTGGGRFVNTTAAANAGAGKRQTFAAVWLHANDDHYPDLYVANDFGANSLLLNDGKGHFRDVSDAAGVGDYSTSMGVAAGDVTGDGLPEIYVANMFSKMGRRIIAHVSTDDYPPGVYDQIRGSCAGNSLYVTSAGSQKYSEMSEMFGVNGVGWAYAPALADFDSDGWLDIYATTGFLSFRRDKPDG